MFCDVGNSKCCWHLERKSEGVSYSCNHYMLMISPLLFETIVTTERTLSFLIQNEAIVFNSCICSVSNTKSRFSCPLSCWLHSIRTMHGADEKRQDFASLSVTFIFLSLVALLNDLKVALYNRIPAEYPAFTVVAQGGISLIASRCWSRNLRPPWSMVFTEIVVVA